MDLLDDDLNLRHLPNFITVIRDRHARILVRLADSLTSHPRHGSTLATYNGLKRLVPRTF